MSLMSLTLILMSLTFLLFQKSDSDISNFDTDFTMEKVTLTPPDKDLLKTMNQHLFSGFSFTSNDALWWLGTSYLLLTALDDNRQIVLFKIFLSLS